MQERILIDTGPLVALIVPHDPYHDSCVRQIATLSGPFYTSLAVVAEACWLMAHSEKAIKGLDNFFRIGAAELLHLAHEEIPAILDYMQRYRNIRADFADATLLYLAQRESIHTVFTLDHRDFKVYRLQNGAPLSIIPAIF